MINKKVYNILNKLSYSQMIQVCRVLLNSINESDLTKEELTPDLAEEVDKCYDIYIKEGIDTKDLIEYISNRIAKDNDGVNVSDKELEELFEEFLY